MTTKRSQEPRRACKLVAATATASELKTGSSQVALAASNRIVRCDAARLGGGRAGRWGGSIMMLEGGGGAGGPSSWAGGLRLFHLLRVAGALLSAGS